MNNELALYLELALVLSGVIGCVYLVRSKVKESHLPILDEVVETKSNEKANAKFEYKLDHLTVVFEKIDQAWTSSLVVGKTVNSLNISESELALAFTKTLKAIQASQKQSCFDLPELLEADVSFPT